MKNILVPYDFSETSENAAEYAVELAKFFDAKLILLHSFQIPLVTGEASFIQYPFDELYTENLELLKRERVKLQKGHAKDVPIDCIVKTGFAGSVIVDEAKEKKADMIVMGISGKNKLAEVIIGSTSVYVSRNSDIPVMIIPPKAQYKKIKRIAFACDYDNTQEGTLMEDVQLFQFMFDAKLDIVNVYDEKEDPTLEKVLTGLAVENSLAHTKHKSFFINNEDPQEGLENFIEQHKPDLLIVAPKKHNLFNRMFHKSITKAMAYHSHLPVLTFHQKEKP